MRGRGTSPEANTAAVVLTGLFLFVLGGELSAQAAVPRILEQDATRDNLVTPAGYATGPAGELGRVRVRGTGDRAMILIPGRGDVGRRISSKGLP